MNYILYIVSFINTTIAGIVGYIAYRQYKTDQRAVRYSVMQYYLKNYQMISQAIALVIQKGYVNSEAESLFWKARDQARLILNKRIAEYTEFLFKLAHKGYLAHLSLYPEHGQSSLSKTERADKAKESIEIILKIHKQTPYKKYREYMA